MTALPEIVKQTGSVLRGLLSLGLILTLCVMMSSCGGGGGSITTPPPPVQPPPATDSLTQADVQMLVQAATMAAQSDSMVIAVVDWLGRILAVYKSLRRRQPRREISAWPFRPMNSRCRWRAPVRSSATI